MTTPHRARHGGGRPRDEGTPHPSDDTVVETLSTTVILVVDPSVMSPPKVPLLLTCAVGTHHAPIADSAPGHPREEKAPVTEHPNPNHPGRQTTG